MAAGSAPRRPVGPSRAIALALGVACVAACGSSEETGPPACEDLLIQEPCLDCLEKNCCDLVRECLEDTAGCAACLAGNPTACAGSATVGRIFACTQESCERVCSDEAPGPACDAPSRAPSAGSCVETGGDVECNPVDNGGCDGNAGEACDYDAGKFQCYPAPNDLGLCEPCGPQLGFCAAGLTCFQRIAVTGQGIAVGGRCARTCCSDGDCGSGTCGEPITVDETRVGVCLERDETP